MEHSMQISATHQLCDLVGVGVHRPQAVQDPKLLWLRGGSGEEMSAALSRKRWGLASGVCVWGGVKLGQTQEVCAFGSIYVQAMLKFYQYLHWPPILPPILPPLLRAWLPTTRHQNRLSEHCVSLIGDVCSQCIVDGFRRAALFATMCHSISFQP